MTELGLRDLRKRPKIELHGHIDGYLSPSDIQTIARKNRRRITTLDGRVINTKNQLLDFWKGDGYQNILQQIVSRFSPVISLMQTENAIRDTAVAYVRRLAEDGIVYAEGRFAPQFHTPLSNLPRCCEPHHSWSVLRGCETDHE